MKKLPRYRVIHLAPYYTRARVGTLAEAECVCRKAGPGRCIVLDRSDGQVYRLEAGVPTAIFARPSWAQEKVRV